MLSGERVCVKQSLSGGWSMGEKADRLIIRQFFIEQIG